VSSIFVSPLGVYQEVIHHKLVQVRFENSIHKIEKGRGGIGHAMGHHREFITTIPGFNCGFGDVYRFNSKLTISKPQIILKKISTLCS